MSGTPVRVVGGVGYRVVGAGVPGTGGAGVPGTGSLYPLLVPVPSTGPCTLYTGPCTLYTGYLASILAI